MTIGRPIAYDRNQLHAFMYHRSDRRNVYSDKLKVLSEETGISYFHLTRIVKEFVEEGRLRRMSRGAHRMQSFIVVNPVDWCEEHDDAPGAVEVARYLNEVEA
jgi:hypothetical protein